MEGKRLLFSIAVLIVSVKNVDCASGVEPLIETKVGLIRGLRAEDGDYSMFMGIPYAYVNETNPFGKSIPHPAFEGIFEAFDDSAICPQIYDKTNNIIIGNLDCLHVNIYVPDTARLNNRLPVMVWIYGGRFERGFSGRYRYGPGYLVQHEVILVTLNYRVGPYGFMCLDTPEVPGNQGLKDQQLALRWVKDNIDTFGGDLNKITIFGESAGGASVDLHLLYNKDNIFNNVIIQSGAALSPWNIADSDMSTPIKLADHLGLQTSNINEALSFLRTVDTNLIIEATRKLGLTFRPCVEKSFDGVEKFIDKHPNYLDLSRVKDIPILAGHTDNECFGYVYYRDPELQKILIIAFLRQFFNFGTNEEIIEAEELLRHFYYGDEDVNKISLRTFADFDSDFEFIYPIARTIQKYLKKGATIYQYLFSYNGNKNPLLNNTGAIHADELVYLFTQSQVKEKPSPEDQVIIDRITTLWTNFVKYGNPTPETSELLPVAWPPVSKDQRPYLNIDTELTIESRPFHARMAFWDLFYKLYYKAERGYHGDE